MSGNSTQKSLVSQGYPGLLEAWKHAGETLAALLSRLRHEYGISDGVPMTYAGRLDPMAEGAMVILVGDKCHDKDLYTGRAKTYQFEVLLGVSTDTADMLGLVTDTSFGKDISPEQLQEALQTLNTRKSWHYPAYSSKTVGGVPLFVAARAGNLPATLPTKEGTILNSKIAGARSLALSDAVGQKIPIIRSVDGDFRQDEVMKEWERLVQKKGEVQVQIISCEATVTSGVYIRTIADEMGKLLGVPALAYSIVRTAFN